MTSRREIIGAGLGLALFPKLGPPRRPKLAAVVTAYTWLSHADVILGRLLDGSSPDGIRHAPRTELVSLYLDQVTPRDMGIEVAGRHGIAVYPTVSEALCLGGPRLAVDGVVLIGEHGDYPTNPAGQKLYPRFELFQQVAAVYRSAGRSVPTFFDKHFSYDWPKAKAMWEMIQQLSIPLLAGSSVPVTVRRPPLEIPLGGKLTEAVVTGYGELEAYGFHAIEALLCMVERRLGGEVGVRRVELLRGEAVWRWRDGHGSWSQPLLTAALQRHPAVAPGRMEEVVTDPAAFVIDFRDGLKAALFSLNGLVLGHGIAVRNPDRAEPWSTFFVEGGPPVAPEEGGTRPLPNFDGLARVIESLMVTRQPPWPAERTLLSTGILAALFESKSRGGPVETADLGIAYRPARRPYFQRQ